jgi:hypothetical protein|tara:strand:+ start:84 stop:440 length:357 start_codon:yes stop_codon:yes gene_type:complete
MQRLSEEEFKENVKAWAEEKGLLKFENRFPQFAKVLEEVQEIIVALNKVDRALAEDNRSDYDEARLLLSDAIGDSFVTLEILSLQVNMSSIDCKTQAWNEIKGRTGKMIAGSFVKDKK